MTPINITMDMVPTLDTRQYIHKWKQATNELANKNLIAKDHSWRSNIRQTTMTFTTMFENESSATWQKADHAWNAIINST